jgi:hypothetical protein
MASCRQAVLSFAKANARRFYVASDLFPDSSPLKQFTRLLPAIRRILATTTADLANQQTTVFIDAGAASYGAVGTVDYSDSLELLSLFNHTRVLVIAYEAQQAKAAELVFPFFLPSFYHQPKQNSVGQSSMITQLLTRYRCAWLTNFLVQTQPPSAYKYGLERWVHNEGHSQWWPQALGRI